MSTPTTLVIAGGGRVGSRVAENFADRGHSVTVIEQDAAVIDMDTEDERIEYIEDDAKQPSVLRDALTEQTDVLGALTASEDTNLAICMAAQRLFPEIRTVARIEDKHGDEYTEYVDDIFFPEHASVKAAVNALSGSDIRTLEDVTGDLELLDIRVDYDAPAAGEVVSDALPEGSVVIAKTHGDVAVQHSTKLVAGRRYVVAADPDVKRTVVEQFRGENAP